ncbi:hypothetical protein OSB04_031633 [Centaurea solstitialis]|uniref:Uncharacterized protein n=1 Tax=Centaurea solstitialis TaxID=347529 RepID=A0AA38SMI0_9ASTR|nr:hypothetical protein OSB04_031633 [Centaurea solstitialis]
MLSYLEMIRERIARFKNFTIEQIPDDQNVPVDTLANLGSTLENIPIIHLTTPMVGLIKMNEEQKMEVQKTRFKASRYTILNDKLYRRSTAGLILRCATNKSQTNQILQEMHDGECGNHSGERSMSHKPSKLLHYMLVPWPFMQWRMDIVPPAPGKKYSYLFLQITFQNGLKPPLPRKNMRAKTLQVGDYVLRRVFQNTQELNAGKLSTKREGPYRISHVVGNGAYKLKTMDNKDIPRNWNAINLKRYRTTIRLLKCTITFYTPSPQTKDVAITQRRKRHDKRSTHDIYLDANRSAQMALIAAMSLNGVHLILAMVLEAVERKITTELLEPFEEPEREFRKRNKKKSKANKVRPRALNFEMGDEAPMWTARRTAPTVPTNPITKPDLNKEISRKPLHMIKDLTFDGKNDSNPIVHMENFVDRCDLFKTEEGQDDAICLRVFPLTLTEEARAWLRSLEPSYEPRSDPFNKMKGRQYPKHGNVGCEECKGPHLTKDCPNRPTMTPEEVNYLNRGDYQGRWSNNRNFIPRPPGFFAPNQQTQRMDGEPRVSIEDRLLQFMDAQKKLNDEVGSYLRNHQSTIQNLELQVGCVSQLLSERTQGELPTQT